MSAALDQLCIEWATAKAAEQAANAARVAVEAKILAETGKKDEGSKTIELDRFKVTVTGKVTRKMDWDQWEKVKDQIPELMRPVKSKLELDEKGVKYLQLNEPAVYALLPITVTPAKTAVAVEIKALAVTV